MSTRYTTKARRGAAAIAMAAALALAVSGCGDDGGGGEPNDSKASSKAPRQTTRQADEPTESAQPEESAKLAEVRGSGGAVLIVSEAKRDAGGFVTVSGTITNNGGEAVNTVHWAGTETDVLAKNPNSVAGATLIDKVGKKRYYTLRDTDGRCLCTTGLGVLVPGKTSNFFVQFPAPPEGTQEVDFTLPTFATATIKISG
ncbi:hypothetical protein [Streptomyces sp. NRRL S-87]|uniref:hypothetical protein n=1 Tax=Streptomyces sp. NRRL S-87 TaxID=1463920 RepID=UPI0004BFECB7|nr:hypothetical protein [Streptomyces sp. NRRL S-87]